MNNEVWQLLSEAAPGSPTLLVFPPTGAGAPAFQSMSVLQGDITVWAYCPPGRGRRFVNTGVRTMDEFLAQILPSIVVPVGPLIVAGVSFGAALAFATTRALEANSISVDKLITLCGTSPSSYTGEKENWDMESAKDRMIRYELTPAAVLEYEDADDLFVAPTLDDLLLAESYDGAHAGPVSAPITCISASDDEIVPACEATLWRDATTSSFRLIKVTGGHYAHTGFGRKEWADVLA